MTVEEIKVINAFKENKVIQRFNGLRGWEDEKMEFPDFDFNHYEYRVKED